METPVHMKPVDKMKNVYNKPKHIDYSACQKELPIKTNTRPLPLGNVISLYSARTRMFSLASGM